MYNGTEYLRWWHWQWGQLQFCSAFQTWQICHVQFCHDKRLGKWYAMFSFAMTSGLASDMPCSVLPWQAAWQVICHVQFCHDKRLGKWYAMFSFAMTSGLASDMPCSVLPWQAAWQVICHVQFCHDKRLGKSSKTEFLLIVLPTQLAKIDNPSLSMPSSTSIKPVASARNLGIIFDSRLSFYDHISYISKTCFAHIHDLRRIRNTLDPTTACTIATSLIHSKLDYCNLNCQQTNRLQLILNSTARAVTQTPKYNHITPHLKSLYWLKTTQRIQYKILSLTYKSLQFKQPSSILDLLKIQPTHSTRSSAVVTLQRPYNPSRLKITDRSFHHQAPALWNSLPQHLRALSSTSPTQTNNSLLSLSSSQFHKQLKTYLSLQSYPP